MTQKLTLDEKELTSRTNNSIEKLVRPPAVVAQNADILRSLAIEDE